MTREEAIKRIRAQKALCCVGCMHPQEIGYCENTCKLPEAYDTAIEALQAEPNCKRCAIKELWQATEKEDLVAVVRCKDCKHYEFADNRAFGMPVKYCDWFGFEDVDDNDFCSRGERKGGE